MSTPPHAPGRAAAPLGLIGTIALIAAIEAAVAHHRLDFTTDTALSWSYSGSLAPRVPGTKILCLGTSLVKCGILPRVLEGRTGRRTWNLAPFGGALPANYYLLKRNLEEGGRPDAVVLDCQDACHANDSPEAQAQAFQFDTRLWADLLRTRECLELAVSARDAAFFARTMAARALPTCKARFEVREAIRAALQGRSTSRREDFRRSLDEWALQRGTHMLVDVQSPVEGRGDLGLARRAGRRPPPARPREGLTAAYVRKLVALCAAHDVALFWLMPPIRPDSQAIRELAGEDEYLAGMARYAQSLGPRVVVIDGRSSGYDGRAFRDVCHLNRAGAMAFSAAVAELVARGLSDPGSVDRWSVLPPFGESLALSEGRGAPPARR